MDYFVPPPEDNSEKWKQDPDEPEPGHFPSEDWVNKFVTAFNTPTPNMPVPTPQQEVPAFVYDVTKRFKEIGFRLEHVHDENAFYTLFYEIKDILVVRTVVGINNEREVIENYFIPPKKKGHS